MPLFITDWLNYGWMTCDVLIVEVQRQFIEQYSIQLDRENRRRIAGWIRLAGASSPQKLSVRIPELKLSTEATTDNEGLARFMLDAPGVQLWSPEKPKLYRVEISTENDQIVDDIGFR